MVVVNFFIITSPGFVYGGGVDNIGNSGLMCVSSLNDKCVLKSRPFVSVGLSVASLLVSGRVSVCVKVGEIEQLVLGSHVMQVCAHVMQVSHVVLIIETHAPIFRTSH